jgi:hypothetical protein
VSLSTITRSGAGIFSYHNFALFIAGSFAVSNCEFNDNHAAGGNANATGEGIPNPIFPTGAFSGLAAGAGLYVVLASSSVAITASLFNRNEADSGSASATGDFQYAFTGFADGAGVAALVGGIGNGPVNNFTMTKCQLSNDQVVGGSATAVGAGTIAYSRQCSGGGLFESLENGDAIITGNDFTSDNALAGAATANGYFSTAFGGNGVGAGIFSLADNFQPAPHVVELSNDRFKNNGSAGGAASSSGALALARAGDGVGAGMYNSFTDQYAKGNERDLVVTNSNFTGNTTSGGAATESGDGGLSIGGIGWGGGIYNIAWQLRTSNFTLDASEFKNNSVTGGDATATGTNVVSNGGSGEGAGVIDGSLGDFTVTRSSFIGNVATAGSGSASGNGSTGIGAGASGGGINNSSATLHVSDCDFTKNSVLAGAGTATGSSSKGVGGNATGGGLSEFAGIVDILGFGTVVVAGHMTVTDSEFTNNQAVGGSGSGSLSGIGGNGYGGGIYGGQDVELFSGGPDVTLILQGCTITNNDAIGGAGSTGGTDGQGLGGGIYLGAGSTFNLDLLNTIIGNFASTSGDDVYGP